VLGDDFALLFTFSATCMAQATTLVAGAAHFVTVAA
jgi:hypothetical protein